MYRTFARTARESFEKVSDTAKREILAALGTNWTLKDRKLRALVEEPLRHIGNCGKMVRTLQETAENRFEPGKNATHRRENDGCVYERLKILPG